MQRAITTFVVATLLACCFSMGTAAQVAQIAKTLSPAAQVTIDRLSELDHLPSGTWRYHAADLPHGEDPNLDDSQWPAVENNHDYGTDGLWLRSWVQVPKSLDGYDLTGAALWFHASLEAHRPLTQIIYVNGQRIAMGENIEAVEAISHVKAGDRILIAVKALPTAFVTRFNGIQITVHFAADRPNPVDVRDEILSAAALLPSFVADTSADRAVIEKAAAQIDIHALDAGEQAKFDASLRAAHSSMEVLRTAMRQGKVVLAGNAHIDAAWLWPASESIDVVRRTYSTALQLMNEYPRYTFTQSAAAYNEWLEQKYPDINKEIAKRIKEGRWEVVGGMWVEPDLNMPDGESTVRSILIGKRWYQQHYGVDVRVGWNPDSFGYTWQLPQMYKKSGIDYFVTQKMTWSDTNHLPFKLFWWESPDGSKVLTYFPRGYANRDEGSVRLSNDLKNAREQAPGMTTMLDLYGVGDHGGGPTRAILDQATRWMEPGKVAPDMQFGTALSYFSTIEKQVAPQSTEWNYSKIANGYQPPTPQAGAVAIPTWKDEMYLEYHRGVFTTQANHKRNMRDSPEWTLNAEKLASLAWLDGDPYATDEITEAWRKISFNNFHDLAAGSGIGLIYKEAQKDYDQVRLTTNEISSKALATLAAHADTGSAPGVPVLVFNTLAWQRSGAFTATVQMPAATKDVSVLDGRGNVLASQIISQDAATNIFHLLVEAKDVPSMGFAVLHVTPGHRPFESDLRAHGTTLENAAIRVTLDPTTGCIISLFNKPSHFEAISPNSCGNELQVFKDTPKIYDAWNIDPGTLDQPPARLTQADSVKLIEQGPLRAVIRVTRHWQSSKFQQDIVLDAGSDQVEVINDFDWHEDHELLKAAFSLSATGPFATYEIPFGTIERPTTRNNSWEKAMFEVPALNWADLGDASHGVSLINDSKYGYDAVGNVLRLTLLRAPTYPDPEADRGHTHFRFALYPHAGTWKDALTIRHGYEFNYDLMAMQTAPHTGTLTAEHSFLHTSETNVVVTAMKKAEDAHSLIVHLYEWKGSDGDVEVTIPPGASSATETNLLEKPEGPPLPIVRDHVTLHIHPFEIVAFRVDYPERVAALAQHE